MYDVINKDPGKPSKVPRKLIDMISDYYTKMKMGNIIPAAGCLDKEY